MGIWKFNMNVYSLHTVVKGIGNSGIKENDFRYYLYLKTKIKFGWVLLVFIVDTLL